MVSVLGADVANLAGFLALFFIIAAAVLMFIKTRLFNRYQSHRTLIRVCHIVIASLGGGFLLIHAEYFIKAPILSTGIFLGYVSTAVALSVLFLGISVLGRIRYSLLFHGSLAFSAISLMVLHALVMGFFFISIDVNIAILSLIAILAFWRAMLHVNKILGRKRGVEGARA